MTIAAFYDGHPYPPAPGDLHDYAERWRDPLQRRASHHHLFPWRKPEDVRTVLVAGCGTAQAARYALRYPDAAVVGIDVSSSSLAEEQRLKDLHDLGNLELRDLPIEDIEGAGSTFDLIVCTGVLHHLADPGAGLRALHAVLAPGGSAHLMLYARWGRTGVAMISEYARMVGVEATRDDIVAFAQTLAEIPPGHPIDHALRETPDFRRVDALADALLNPREVAYAVPELLELLDQTGWHLRRWYRQAPYLPRCGAVSETPHAQRLGELSARQQYAAMELFRGTMTTHSLVAGGESRLPIDPLELDDWADLVPLRMPGARTIDERTPPGAAAVLLNDQHTFTDLVLPIDERERLVVDAVDGERTIGEITVPDEPARSLMRDLWAWDQVVFDASGTKSSEDTAQDR